MGDMTRSIRSTRILPVTVLALVAALTAMLVAPSPSSAAPASHLEIEVVAAMNADRAADGLTPLRLSDDLTTVARRQSDRMAEARVLHHNPELGDHVDRWRKVGENVGRSSSVDAVHGAFMASPSHAANIADADFTEVGIGVVVRDGTLWVTQGFRDPSTSGRLPF